MNLLYRLKNHIRRASGLSNPTLKTAPIRSGRSCWASLLNWKPSFMSRDFSTDQGTTVALSHHERPQHRIPTTQIGAMSLVNPTPAARMAVISLALWSLPRT